MLVLRVSRLLFYEGPATIGFFCIVSNNKLQYQNACRRQAGLQRSFWQHRASLHGGVPITMLILSSTLKYVYGYVYILCACWILQRCASGREALDFVFAQPALIPAAMERRARVRA